VVGGVALGLYDFKYRFYDPQLGRFFTQDRLAEKFAYMSPYQFCSNSPIWLKELDGLEGIKYTENGVETIEKNIVVLTEQRKVIPQNADQKTIDKITKQNGRIDSRNEAKINGVREELNNFYGNNTRTQDKNLQRAWICFSYFRSRSSCQLFVRLSTRRIRQ